MKLAKVRILVTNLPRKGSLLLQHGLAEWKKERKINIDQPGKSGLLAYITHLMILKPAYFLKGSAPSWPTPTA